ncbi:hypothetical protein GC106_22290 [Kibdelosporangium sp. 4NS15]|uniref:Uncharacterized protein n=1 Tax=Kibdelosporangium persicum TaxID=2698649 RepID=A0ABX2F125_9PSEU|nr:hypothetical protein [Kibdelosporangium persicum]NRN65019.1 hypothetical protein [Kibdelosporangium persicum]
MSTLHRGHLPAAHVERPKPAVTLTPGLRLRTEVGVALHDLSQAGDVRAVLDNLRGALAYTAAIGETAMIARAAESVRLAIGRLEAGLADAAAAALADASRVLSPAPPPHREAALMSAV